MLTGLDIEIVAFFEEWGELYCLACAGKRWGELTCAKAARGLPCSADIEPATRYEVIEEAEERGYETALARLERFKAEHPMLADALPGNDMEAVESRIVTRFSFWVGRDRCEDCGLPIVGLADLRKAGVWAGVA